MWEVINVLSYLYGRVGPIRVWATHCEKFTLFNRELARPSSLFVINRSIPELLFALLIRYIVKYNTARRFLLHICRFLMVPTIIVVNECESATCSEISILMLKVQ